jgi:hypothetical protein
MGQLFTRARFLAWQAAQPAPRLLAATHRRAETYCLAGLSLLLALACYYR